jgi:hypothetical protein
VIYEKNKFPEVLKNVMGSRLPLRIIALSLCLLLLPTVFSLIPTTRVLSASFEQETRNQGVKVNGAEKLCYALSKGEEIKIQINGSLTELYSYQNLFQTSKLNAGIRFEIDANGQGGLVIGNTSPNGYSGLVLPSKFEKGRFDLLIRIIEGRSVLVSYLGQDILKVFEGLQFECDEVIAGYGYDSSRVIRGDMKFIATASYLKPGYIPIWLDDVVRLDWYRALAAGQFFVLLMYMAFKLSIDIEDEAVEVTNDAA